MVPSRSPREYLLHTALSTFLLRPIQQRSHQQPLLHSPSTYRHTYVHLFLRSLLLLLLLRQCVVCSDPLDCLRSRRINKRRRPTPQAIRTHSDERPTTPHVRTHAHAHSRPALSCQRRRRPSGRRQTPSVTRAATTAIATVDEGGCRPQCGARRLVRKRVGAAERRRRVRPTRSAFRARRGRVGDFLRARAPVRRSWARGS